LRLVRVAHVVDAAGAVHEGVDEEEAVVGREADVDGERHVHRIRDVGDVARLERAVVLLLDEPDLGFECGGGEGVVVPGLESPVMSMRPGRAKNVCGPTTPSLSLTKESMVRTTFGCAGSGARSKTQIMLSSRPPAQR